MGAAKRFMETLRTGILAAKPFKTEIDHFLHCIRTGEAPLAPIEHDVIMQRMLEGIHRSAALGREVQI